MRELDIQEASVKTFLGLRVAILLRCGWALAGLLAALGLAAPYLNANAFKAPVQELLEETLGRRVEIGSLHFTLFTGPGFRLERVTIHEDPHYGLEPFAFIPTMELRIRLDKLMLGQIRPLGLRMIDASLNLVKSDDGSWNAVTLVERLGAPRRAPFNFFPAVQITNSRIDFKLGKRKTTLYITETDVSVYPQSSGKIYLKFEGSPARTDRAGNGFGHLVGTANWYLKPATATANGLEADVNLEPSNLSELATLIQGQDLGVHGTVSAHVLISGPFADLRAQGSVLLQDVHRWDLLPAPGDSLQAKFRATVDLKASRLEFATVPNEAAESPVSLQLRANEFMTKPTWSLLASLKRAPLASLLPLGRRMGIALPAGLQMDGTLDGVIGYSSTAGLEGGVVVTDAVANIPNVPPLRSALANVKISADTLRIEPAILESDSGGTLRAGGDFSLATQAMRADISADHFSVVTFKQMTSAWFGAPDALAQVTGGQLSGRFLVSYPAGAPVKVPVWAGQVQFADASLAAPGVALPVRHMQGKGTFDENSFDVPRLAGTLGEMAFTGSYHYSAATKRPERLRLEFGAADLAEIEAALMPTLSDDSLLSHLPFTKRTIPEWLANRSMEGDIAISRFSIRQVPQGALAAHFIWQGTGVQLTNVRMALDTARVQGAGSIALSARLPRYHFAMKIDGYAWGGGVLAAEGELNTSGMGPMTLAHLAAAGSFSGAGLALQGADSFSAIWGQFDFAFNGDTPDLKLTKVEARQNEEDWTGQGGSDAQGKLHLDLSSGDKQMHLVTDLTSAESQARAPQSGQP